MRKNLKELTEKRHWLKYIPNSLTLCNSLCGFASIVVALGYNAKVLNGELPTNEIFVLSSWLILGAMIFDCLDGFAARMLNAASMHGLQMDSLADMVTFGVAPATLVTAMTYSLKSLDLRHAVLVWILAGVYLGGAALRLATYNVHAILEKKSDDKFHGLPSPGAAAAICTTILFYNQLKADHSELWWLLPIYGAVLGLLMVSPIRYVHVGKWLTTVPKSKKKIFIVLVIAAVFVVRPALTAFSFINAYILIGILKAAWNACRKPAGKEQIP